MKVKMKIKVKYKAFMYVPHTLAEEAKIDKPVTIKRPTQVRNPVLAFPRLVLQV